MKLVIIGDDMAESDQKAREYYELILNALAGLEDDLLASGVPPEAVEHLRAALDVCNSDFRKRFGSDRC
jgi:hypothetical protein